VNVAGTTPTDRALDAVAACRSYRTIDRDCLRAVAAALEGRP
jgi:hypothetical protein